MEGEERKKDPRKIHQSYTPEVVEKEKKGKGLTGGADSTFSLNSRIFKREKKEGIIAQLSPGGQ